jgi:group II intron reverse transcriptase/maturase
VPAAVDPRDEPAAGKRDVPESVSNCALLDQVLERTNLQRALKQVRQNKGAPGIDGMSVDELPGYLRDHWLEIRTQLVAGNYCPQPVRRVEIPKDNGQGVRLLGVPTVLDRFLQQAIAQVVSAQWEAHFHPKSYGFRPQRSAHEAVRQLQADIRDGYRWVVDLDLEAFFDRVNHDRLMSRLKQHVPDTALLRLINRFLKAGVHVGDHTQATTMGVPQGGPLSPVLSNVVLDELDWELERRGHRFARYADDCNIVVKSERAGKRVMQSVTRFIEDSLRLTVNARKSAVDRPWNRKFLGFTVSRNGTKLKVADKAIDKLKDRVRELTRRTRGHRLDDIVAELRETLLGWKAYFGIAEVLSPEARHRQMDTTQVTLLHMEAMGTGGLPGTAKTWGERARSMAHIEVGAWTVETVKDSGARTGTAGALLQQSGAAAAGGELRNSLHRTAEYVTRSLGGVGGRGREASSYPD